MVFKLFYVQSWSKIFSLLDEEKRYFPGRLFTFMFFGKSKGGGKIINYWNLAYE